MLDNMKKLITILLLLLSFNANAIDLGTFDPTKADEDRLTLGCIKPAEHIDESIINPDDIILIQWAASTNGGAYIKFGEALEPCSKVIDLTKLDDGDYSYKAFALDDDRTSLISDELANITIKRSAPAPKQVTGITGSVD